MFPNWAAEGSLYKKEDGNQPSSNLHISANPFLTKRIRSFCYVKKVLTRAITNKRKAPQCAYCASRHLTGGAEADLRLHT